LDEPKIDIQHLNKINSFISYAHAFILCFFLLRSFPLCRRSPRSPLPQSTSLPAHFAAVAIFAAFCGSVVRSLQRRTLFASLSLAKRAARGERAAGWGEKVYLSSVPADFVPQ